MTLTRDGIAYRVARDLPDGAYVNLGIGIPFLVTSYLDPASEIFIHSENGILGVGPVAARGKEDPDLVNASKDYITLLPGSSVFDHALSFTMIRGGHLTHAVIGAIEVAANGDLANWHVPGQKVPGVGGAMDIAASIENLYVAMTHATNRGEPKIVEKCTCPLTARRCVKRIYTDLALIDLSPEGLVLREVAPGITPAAVQKATGVPLLVAAECREMDIPASFNGKTLRH